MVENGRVIHLVLENSLAFVLLEVHLAKQVDLLVASLQNNLTVGPDMTRANVFSRLFEYFLVWLFVRVVVSLDPARHAKVVEEERLLVDMLEDLELTLLQRQFEPILEVSMRGQSVVAGSFLLWLDYQWQRLQLIVLQYLLNVRSMKRVKFILLPIQFEEGEVLNTLGMIELVSEGGQHLVSVCSLACTVTLVFSI